jgi:hypothetical protein
MRLRKCWDDFRELGRKVDTIDKSVAKFPMPCKYRTAAGGDEFTAVIAKGLRGHLYQGYRGFEDYPRPQE